jgi:hypothetical protein
LGQQFLQQRFSAPSQVGRPANRQPAILFQEGKLLTLIKPRTKIIGGHN